MTIFEHINALRAMGCAVCVITTEDIQILTADDDDEFTLTEEQAFGWMALHYDDDEEAIMGDYWSESVRAVLEQYPPKQESEDA